MYTQMCTKLWVVLDSLKRDMRGVSAIEYAILAAVLIGVVSAAVIKLDLGTVFGDIGTKVKDTVANPPTN